MLRLAWLSILLYHCNLYVCMYSCFLHGILVRRQFHLNKGYTSPTALRPAEIRAVHVSTAKFVQIEKKILDENLDVCSEKKISLIPNN